MDSAIASKTGGRPGRIELMEGIVAEHETALLRYATRFVNDPTAAQDVVQNVFVKLVTHWQDGMRPSKKLKGWLFRVTHNEAIDLIRRESRLRVLHNKKAEQEKICTDGAHCPAPADDRKKRVLKELTRLHPREQQIVILRLEQGMSYNEIAEITGRTRGNVGNILHHAVQKLAERLGGI
jgi:RNA polymerase sigma factor (sigma-70 family)